MTVLCDVNLSQLVAQELRARGFNTRHVIDFLDPRSSDRDIIEEARRRNAILLTRDLDFSAILATSAAIGPSLIQLRVSIVEVNTLVDHVTAVLQKYAAELQAGAIVTIDDNGSRMHGLPIE